MITEHEIFEYVIQNIKNINIENCDFIVTLKKKITSLDAKKIYSIGCKQTKNKKFREFFGFTGQITKPIYWVSRGWDEKKLFEYQSSVSKNAIKKGTHKGRFSETWFKTKYGVDNGLKKYSLHILDRSLKNKREYQIKKKGENAWLEQMHLKKQDLDNFVYRYGDVEGRRKFTEFVEKSKQTKENFIIRHGELVGLIKWDEYISKLRFNSSEEAWIIKFGAEGRQLRTAFFTSTLGVGDRKFSIISKKMFDDLSDQLDNKELCYYGENELNVLCEGRSFKPDFIYKNKIIEFYGDFWHANPDKYSETDIISMPGRKEQTAKDVWDRDKERMSLLSQQGFDYEIVWESEYKNSPELTISKLLNFLNP